MVNIIGFSGKARGGKDTSGDYLVKHHGYTRIGFADALKDACRSIFGFSEEQLYGDLKEVDDEYWRTSPRKVLQYVGTDLFRDQLSTIMPDVGSDIWIKVVENKILKNPDKKYVITDVRFGNELAFIKKYHGMTIKVQRDVLNNVDSHVSESYIDNMVTNYTIKNNGTLEELYEKLDNIMFNNNYRKIHDFDKIKIIDDALYVLDIDETLMVYDGIDSKWWKKNIRSRPEKEVLEDWIEHVTNNEPKHTAEESFKNLLNNIGFGVDKNNVICLTARKDMLKDLTEKHLLQIGVSNIPVYYSNGDCKGKKLQEIVKNEYPLIKNIVFVDDNKKNLAAVTKEFHGSSIEVYCYYFKFLENKEVL